MSETLTARTEEAVRSPADVYDEQFVPALFRHWGPVLCDAANITSGQRVLIHGASGGVGTALLQLGRLAGLAMYGTCSAKGASAVSDEKIDV